MIFKIKKHIFDMKSDYSVKNALGETVCKVAVLTKGYSYIIKPASNLLSFLLKEIQHPLL